MFENLLMSMLRAQAEDSDNPVNQQSPALLGGALTGRDPGAIIEEIEAEGQREVCAVATSSDGKMVVLKLAANIKGNGREVLEGLGFVFPTEERDILIEVQAPAGWQLVRTDHNMWNDLLDPDGNKRGAMFYKAAFYDRSAYLDLCCRFNIRSDYADHIVREAIEASETCDPDLKPIAKLFYANENFDPHRNEDHAKLPYQRYQVVDADGHPIWTGPWVSRAEQKARDNWAEGVTEEQKAANDAWQDEVTGRAWLNKYYPNWEDVTAYWDLLSGDPEATKG